MAAVPDATPLTIPVEPTVAIPVAVLLHVPPVVASASVVVALLHKVRLPVIAAGNGLTVTTAVMIQPVGAV